MGTGGVGTKTDFAAGSDAAYVNIHAQERCVGDQISAWKPENSKNRPPRARSFSCGFAGQYYYRAKACFFCKNIICDSSTRAKDGLANPERSEGFGVARLLWSVAGEVGDRGAPG